MRDVAVAVVALLLRGLQRDLLRVVGRRVRRVRDGFGCCCVLEPRSRRPPTIATSAPTMTNGTRLVEARLRRPERRRRPIRDGLELLALTDAGQEDLSRADELEAHVAELDDVARLDDAASQIGAVHAHAVRRALVDDLVAPVAERVDLAVEARHRVVVDGDGARPRRGRSSCARCRAGTRRRASGPRA